MNNDERRPIWRRLSRRGFLTGVLGLGAIAGAAGFAPGLRDTAAVSAPVRRTDRRQKTPPAVDGHGGHTATGVSAPRPAQAPVPGWNAESPADILTAYDWGRATTLPGGETLREYSLIAREAEVEVARGVRYPAWTYNGTVPGPTIRCTEGDHLKIYFTNETNHPHGIHLHGVHAANMDGVFEQVLPGGSFTYELVADPFGLFLYHCHTMPVKKHVEKGLYGTFIVDPREPRPPAREMVMVMNGFDTDGDGENEFYTVNGVANYFLDNPIQVPVGELIRVYLVNLTEFDLINSFHLHGNMFKLYRTGTRLDQYEITDTVTLGQGERAILEFSYKYPGQYMFHAHQSEFAELGWMGIFDVKG